MGVAIGVGSGGGWAWSADNIVRIGEVPARVIRLDQTHPDAIRLSEMAPRKIALEQRRSETTSPGPKESGVRNILKEMYPSMGYSSNNERTLSAVLFEPSLPFDDLERDFELRNGSVLRKAHFQRLPDGWFRIQHQAGLGNYHIREFNEKDQTVLAAWRAQEFSRLELDPVTRESLSDVTVNRRKLDYTLIPEIKLEEVHLEEVIRFLKSYSIERDPARKGMQFEMDVWDPQQPVTLPMLRYVSLNQLLKLVAQQTGTVIEIGSKSILLRDPSKVRTTEPQG